MMTDLRQIHLHNGATLAEDGIPLSYPDPAQEYQYTRHRLLFDRSHEGRIRLTGKDRLNLLNRISTNDLKNMAINQSKATIFCTATARILFYVSVYHAADHTLIITQPGQGVAFAAWLQKQIFYQDDLTIEDITDQTKMFALHGKWPTELSPSAPADDYTNLTIAQQTVSLLKAPAILAPYWKFILPASSAAEIYQELLQLPQLIPSGSINYNLLRIKAGQPARAELTQDYNPLELGLWDDISFTKGCYTGQEIIARMDSREKLAKALYHVQVDEMVTIPATIMQKGGSFGQLTSLSQSPDGEIFGLAIIKLNTNKELALYVGQQQLKPLAFAGSPPPYIAKDN